MILKGFIDHKLNCPLCNNPLNVSLETNSYKRIQVEYKDNRAIFSMNLRKSKNSMSYYNIIYSFSLQDNSFHIDFCDDPVTILMLNKFKNYNNNISNTYRFIKRCLYCEKYSATSTDFHLSYKDATINDILIWQESFCMILPTDTDYKIMCLFNFYKTDNMKSANKSIIVHWRSDEAINFNYNYPENHSWIETGLIPFVSLEKTRERLNTLIIFS